MLSFRKTILKSHSTQKMACRSSDVKKLRLNGANICEVSRLGLSTPTEFIVGADSSHAVKETPGGIDFDNFADENLHSFGELETATSKRFGSTDPDHFPLVIPEKRKSEATNNQKRKQNKKSYTNMRRAATDQLAFKLNTIALNDGNVGKLMQEMNKFYTTTKPGNAELFVLLFPPSTCQESNKTFGNRTGNELATSGIKIENVSVIEIFPFYHTTAANKFDQKLFSKLYKKNEKFRNAINEYFTDCFTIEMKATELENQKKTVYIGGQQAQKVYREAFSENLVTREPEQDGEIYLLYRSCKVSINEATERTIDIYAMEGVHPSYHLVKARQKDASELYRQTMDIYKALHEWNTGGKPMKELLTDLLYAAVKKYNDVVDFLKEENWIKELGGQLVRISKEKVLKFRPSCLHTTSVDHIKKAINFLIALKCCYYVPLLHLGFSQQFTSLSEDEWNKLCARLKTWVENNREVSDRCFALGSFWSAVSSRNDDEWKKLCQRLKTWVENNTRNVSDRCFALGSFWSAVSSQDDEKWKKTINRLVTITETVNSADFGICDSLWSKVSKSNNEEWDKIINRLNAIDWYYLNKFRNLSSFWCRVLKPDEEWEKMMKNVREIRLQNLISHDFFWTHSTLDYSGFFAYITSIGKNPCHITRNDLKIYKDKNTKWWNAK